MDKDYFGNDIGNRPTRSRAQCVEFCLSNPNCNGASFSDIDSVCYLKAIPDGARKVLETSASTFKFCPGQAEEITTGADVPVVATTGANLPIFADNDSPRYRHVAWIRIRAA